MAQNDRLLGKIGLDTLTVTPNGGSTIIIKNDVANITLNIENNTENASAVLDQWEYPIGLDGKWSIDIEMFMPADVNTSNLLATRALSKLTVDNTFCTVELLYKSPAAGHTNRGDKWTGQAIVSTSAVNVPGGHLTTRATLLGQGALTLTVPS